MTEDKMLSCYSLRNVCILANDSFDCCCDLGNSDLIKLSPKIKYKSHNINDIRSSFYEFLDLKLSLIKRHQHGVKNPCSNCKSPMVQFRSEDEWNSINDKAVIKVLALSFSWACNLRCSYCPSQNLFTVQKQRFQIMISPWPNLLIGLKMKVC